MLARLKAGRRGSLVVLPADEFVYFEKGKMKEQ